MYRYFFIKETFISLYISACTYSEIMKLKMRLIEYWHIQLLI